MSKRFTIAGLLIFCGSAPLHADPVTYNVTFDATWSATTHPSAYPAGAHFSPLVGAVHNDQVSFWDVGGLATAGIERMAEVGSTSLLRGEIQAAIAAGHANPNVILGSGVNSPGATSLSIQPTTAHSRVTLVTMIAPSPDWFLGVSGLDLREGGGWRPEFAVDLFAYDAGTDSGVSFLSPNSDTNPRQPIALLGAPFSNGTRLGTYRFSPVSIPEPGSWVLATLAAAGGLIRLRWRGRRGTS